MELSGPSFTKITHFQSFSNMFSRISKLYSRWLMIPWQCECEHLNVVNSSEVEFIFKPVDCFTVPGALKVINLKTLRSMVIKVVTSMNINLVHQDDVCHIYIEYGKMKMKKLCLIIYFRAPHIPVTNMLGHVKLSVEQVDSNSYSNSAVVLCLVLCTGMHLALCLL